METTITIKIIANPYDWHAVIAEEREGAAVSEVQSYCFDTMPEDFGEALEAYLDANILAPIAKKLPLKSYTYIPTQHTIGRIDRFESGYHETFGDYAGVDADTMQQMVDQLNKRDNVTPAQANAMEIGSMFGWNCPGADPDQYNEDGTPKRGGDSAE